ncbi:hypothetical protein BHM03_00050666 [Ensete ventricosum]|nr:hypothetical protein BHM03_00050666 [Ensete ventricosum]
MKQQRRWRKKMVAAMSATGLWRFCKVVEAAIVEMVAAKVRLRQRDEGAAECTTIAEEGNSSMERETATGHV